MIACIKPWDFSSSFFPPKQLRALESEAEPRNYSRKIYPVQLIKTLIAGMLLRAPSLEGLIRANWWSLATRNKSTLSYAIRRMSTLTVAKAMVAILNGTCRLDRDSIAIIDSMAATLPSSQPSNCARFNKNTVGGGVLWLFVVNAAAGTSPVQILKFMRGSWNDCFQIRDCPLVSNGPIYVMDRGFYSLVTMKQWLKSNVRFVLRAKAHQCHYQVLSKCAKPRKIGNVRVEDDCVALLGRDAKTQVKVRLLWCTVNGDTLILTSSELDATAERLLEIYKLRWKIERFHKVIKHVIGLAHLYSFQANGLELLVYISFIIAVLMYLSADAKHLCEDLVNRLRSEVKNLRQQLGLTDWKPNVHIRKRQKKRKGNH